MWSIVHLHYFKWDDGFNGVLQPPGLNLDLHLLFAKLFLCSIVFPVLQSKVVIFSCLCVCWPPVNLLWPLVVGN
jgi:hypothetical protein